MLSNHGYIKDPVVNVNIANFKISVLGEVLKPGIYEISGERITIFEAISKSGDMTIYGKRKNVKRIREFEGRRIIEEIDLNDPSIIKSPNYFLTQNAVIYIEPHNFKAHQRSYITSWRSVIWYLSLG